MFKSQAFDRLVEACVVTMPPGGNSRRTRVFASLCGDVVTGAAAGRAQTIVALVKLAAFVQAWAVVLGGVAVVEMPAAQSGERPS